MRGQTSMEFLTTYGWVMIVVAVAIGAYLYLFPNQLFTDSEEHSCEFTTGSLQCLDVFIGNNGVAIRVKNIGNIDVRLQTFEVSADNLPTGSCTADLNGQILPPREELTVYVSNPLTCKIQSANSVRVNILYDIGYNIATSDISVRASGSAAATPQNVPVTGDVGGSDMILYWTFDQNQNPTPDESGVNDGTVSDAVWTDVDCVKGGCYQFSGTSTSYVIANPVDGWDDTITIAFWMKSATIERSLLSYVSMTGGSYTDDMHLYNVNDLAFIRKGEYRGIGWHFPNNQWHFVAFTYDANTGELHTYLDGNTVKPEIIKPGEIMGTGGSFVVAQGQDSVGGSFTSSQAGTYDEVMVFNRILSEEEIETIRQLTS